MTITIIAISVTAWILLSAFFVTAACALSARLRQVNLAGDEHAANARTRSEADFPTRPVGKLK